MTPTLLGLDPTQLMLVLGIITLCVVAVREIMKRR